MAKTQNDRAVIDLIINGQQSKTSLKEVSLEATKARSALNKMRETDPGYKEKLKELHALLAAQRQMSASINQTSTAWSRFKTSAASTATGLIGGNLVGSAISVVTNGIPALIAKYREFDAASRELSAVTGATGADLAYLNATAAKTGPTFGKSGAEMLEAYKLMASAKPELLAQKELLTQTTEAAITLAQAGKIDLASATTVTAESLNQFGESADQANRFINVIAAGAKEGSAEIADMGVALKNSGTVAKAQGVSFEQTNAVLQSMSTIALKGGEAGTQLRNVLLTLGSGSDDTNPKVVGLEKALENLGNKNLSTAQMTKLFGKENVTAAQHIITHRNEISELTKKVTGTQEAFSQAKKNNESLDHQLEVFWARVSALGILLGTKLIPAFTKVVEVGLSLTKFLTGSLTPASEAATQAFDDQKAKVLDLTRNLSPLLSRHDELTKKTILTKDEQAELKTIVGQVAAIVPSAVTEFDKYGNALGINTDKARDFIQMQKELLKYTNKKAIDETQDELAGKQRELKASVSRRKIGKTADEDLAAAGGGYRQMTEEELRALDEQTAKLRDEIAALEARKRGLTGDYLSTPTAPVTGKPADKPAASGGGGLSDEQKKKQKERIDANHEATLAIEKMNQEAIKNDKARELAQAQFEADQEKEKVRTSKASAELKARWIKGIEDRLVVDKLKIDEKYTNAERKADVDHLKDVQELAEKELQLKLRLAQTDIESRVAAGGISKEQGKALELEAEQQFLLAKELLYSQHYESMMNAAWGNKEVLTQVAQDLATSLTGIDQAQLDKEGEQATARQELRKAEKEHSTELYEKKKQQAADEVAFRRQMAEQLFSVLSSDWSATLEGYKTFWKESSTLQKVALIAQKAWALAEIGINLARQISLITTMAAAMNAVLPGSGIGVELKGIAKAVGVAALQSAAVIGVQLGTPAFEAGGFTNEGPAGYVNSPTLFQMGKRKFIAGEKGREFVISNRALQNPVVADFARLMDVAQKSGNYGLMNAAAAGGASGASTAGLPGGSSGGMSHEVGMAILQQLQKNNDLMASYAQRPISFDMFAHERALKDIDFVREATKG